MADYVKVANTTDLPPGQATLVSVGEKRIALFNVGGTVFAIDDACTHHGGPLSEGECDNGVVTCPWHGAQFDLRDGQVLAAPAARAVSVYRVRVADGVIEIEV